MLKLRKNLREANDSKAEKEISYKNALAQKNDEASFLAKLMSEINEIKLVSDSVVQEYVPKLRQPEKPRADRPQTNETKKETSVESASNTEKTEENDGKNIFYYLLSKFLNFLLKSYLIFRYYSI